MDQGSREQSTAPPATTAATATATEEEEGKKNKKVKLLLCYEHLEDNVRASTKAYHWYSINPNEKLYSTADSPRRIHSVLPKMIADHRSHFGCCALDSKIYVVGGLRLDEWEDKVESPKKEMVQAKYSCLDLDDIDVWKCFPSSGEWGESEDEEKVTGLDPHVLPIPKEELKAEEESKQEQVPKEEEDEFKRLKEKEHFGVILELLNEVTFSDPSDDNYDVWHEEPPKYYAKPVVFSDVLVCDLNSSPREWNKAISMNTVRSHPEVIPVDGKIYIFGSSFDALIPEAKPWAEVFYPNEGTCESLEDPPIVAESKEFSFHPSYDIQTLPSRCLALKHLTFHNKIALFITTDTLGSRYYSFSTDTESWDQPPSIPPLFDGSFRDSKNYVVVDQTLYAFHLGNLFFSKLDQKDSASHQIHGLEELTKSIGYGLDEKPSFFFHLGDQDFCLVWGVQYFGDLRRSSPCELIRCLKFHISQEEKTQDRIAVMDMCNYYLADGFELIACLQLGEESDLQEENGRAPTRELTPN